MSVVARFGQTYTEDIPVACLSSDAVGDFVCIRDVPVGGKWRVQKADPGDLLTMPAVGVLIQKSTPTVGVVKLWGPVSGIFTGLEVGRMYCVDYNGIRRGPPIVGPMGYAIRQYIGVAVATDVLMVSIDPTMLKRR